MRFVRLMVALGMMGACAAEDPASVDVAANDTADVGSDIVDPEMGPPSFTERGVIQYRAIVHLHSAFSHDACDEKGLDADGKPNMACVRRMKASLCKERIDVAFMTDHPSFMAEQSFEDLLYAEIDRGDELVTDGQGGVRGVSFDCEGTDRRVFLVPGFEGTHTMPIGLQRQLPDAELYGTSFTTTTDDAALVELTEAVRDAGGLVAIAHSEQDSIDAQTIAAHDVSAMEIYNFHANFNEVIGDGLADMITQLNPFLGPVEEAIPGDLVAFLMLGKYPEAALEKWKDVLAIRPITAIAGSDVHENVVFPAICAELDCSDLAEDYPNLVAALTTGGPLALSDGERIDAYDRVFRWVTNHVRVKGIGDPTLEPQRGLEEGRNLVVFGLLGDPTEFDFVAQEPGDGPYAEIGDTASGDASLWIRPPTIPDGSQVRIKLHHVGPEGAVVVSDEESNGSWKEATGLQKGAYFVEVWMQPLFLAESLGELSYLAEGSYRWVVSNPIYVK